MYDNSERERQLNVPETLAGQRMQTIWSAVEGIRRTLGISEVPAPRPEVQQLPTNVISLEEQRARREQNVANQAIRSIEADVALADVYSIHDAKEDGYVKEAA